MARILQTARQRRRMRTLGVFVIVAFGAYFALIARVYAYGVGSHLTRSHFDAAIVLGAAVRGDQPSPVFRDRIDQGIRLFKSGKVDWLVLTGGRPESAPVAESEIARRYAESNGVPANRMLTETGSHNTYQNLYYTLRAVKSIQLKSFVIVTDPYHLRRAMTMADEQGMDAEPSGVPHSRMNSLSFLLNETWRDAKHNVRRLWSSDGGEMAMASHG